MLSAEKRNNQEVSKAKKMLATINSTVITALIIFSVSGLNFLFYAKNDAYQVFYNNIFAGDFVAVLSIIGFFSVFVAVLFSFSNKMQKIISVLVFCFFVLVFLNQYLNVSSASFLGHILFAHDVLNNYSHAIMLFVVGFLLLYFLMSAKVSSMYYFSLTLFVLFLTQLTHLYIRKPDAKEMEVVYGENQKAIKTSASKKFVYISLGDLSSYQSLYDINKEEADVVLGFFAKNNFKLYPNAYVLSLNADENFSKTLNLGKDNEFVENKDVFGYLKLNKINNEKAFLKKAFLYDVFRQGDYKINAYQSNNINICKVDGEYKVDKCVDSPSENINTNIKGLSTANKATLLLSDWINSFDMGVNIAFLNNKKYSDVYYAHSIKQLKEIFASINKDNSQSAYFIDFNMPSSSYVFDENCNVKPFEEWNNNKDAFFAQNKCLFATLEELLENIDNKNTVLVIASQVSNANSFENAEKNYKNNFKMKNLVTFAIKDPMQKEFAIDYNICAKDRFLSNYLFKKQGCSAKELNLAENTIKAMEIDLLRPFDSRINKATKAFESFYQKYSKAKSND